MNIQAIIDAHSAEIQAIKSGLAMDFDAPAQRIINAGFERMGIDRFTRQGDDLWEMISCHLNGWDYERPPARLTQRWATY